MALAMIVCAFGISGLADRGGTGAQRGRRRSGGRAHQPVGAPAYRPGTGLAGGGRTTAGQLAPPSGIRSSLDDRIRPPFSAAASRVRQYLALTKPGWCS